MNQSSFKFGGREARRYQPDRSVEWAEITVANPVKYPGLSQTIALMALHRADKPHDRQRCPLCTTEAQERAA